MAQHPSARLRGLFAKVEEGASRLTAIAEEEARLRARLDELWREKTFVVASLADDARLAGETAAKELLSRNLIVA